MKNENPFLINQYIRPKFFFGRKQETSAIIVNLNNSKNVQLLGRRGVGKTSLVNRFLNGKYSDTYKLTVGAIIQRKIRVSLHHHKYLVLFKKL